ncbi:MAG TPA: hypothetical protein VJO33_09790 [Gemmatimonadaceae bacterium]|nr:hypothetical protein [Gemmatimonadaceae bacterium]
MSSSSIARVLGVALGSIIAGKAAAQCRPPANSHEARLLTFYEVPAIFSLPAAPERMPAGAIEVGAEAAPVPSPSAALTHPEYCYQYTTNNTKLASLFGRPRIVVGLPAAITLEASYLPPITFMSARATVASVAVARAETLGFGDPRLTLLLRAYGTVGRVTGPITCPRAGLQTTDAGAPCYGTAPSSDHFDPNSLGIEGALGASGARFSGYVGGGATWLSPHFQAGFTDAAGITDRTTVDVALVRGSAFAGGSLRLRDDLRISAQLYAVPAAATTARIAFAYRVR